MNFYISFILILLILIIKIVINDKHILCNLITIEIINISLFLFIGAYSLYINIIEFILMFQVIILSRAALALGLLINICSYNISDKILI